MARQVIAVPELYLKLPKAGKFNVLAVAQIWAKNG